LQHTDMVVNGRECLQHRRVLVPFDGTPLSLASVRAAAWLWPDSKVTVFHAIDRTPDRLMRIVRFAPDAIHEGRLRRSADVRRLIESMVAGADLHHPTCRIGSHTETSPGQYCQPTARRTPTRWFWSSAGPRPLPVSRSAARRDACLGRYLRRADHSGRFAPGVDGCRNAIDSQERPARGTELAAHQTPMRRQCRTRRQDCSSGRFPGPSQALAPSGKFLVPMTTRANWR
jgi:hypothetical protein